MFNARRRNVVCSLIFGCWRRKIFRAHVKINEWTWKLWIMNRMQATEMTRRIRCSDAWLIAWQRSCFAKLFVSEISETTKTTLCQILVEVTQRHTVPLQRSDDWHLCEFAAMDDIRLYAIPSALTQHRSPEAMKIIKAEVPPLTTLISWFPHPLTRPKSLADNAASFPFNCYTRNVCADAFIPE